jgi:glycosyltransferase involved in cell wall biosynthesis
MKNITLEMERMRNLNSGLGQYCLRLSAALSSREDSTGFHFSGYMPEKTEGESAVERIPAKWYHRWLGVNTRADLWHCMHQDSPYWPSSTGTPVTMTVHDLNYLERPDYSSAKKKRKTRQLQRKIDRCRGLVYISGFVREQVSRHLHVPAYVCERVIFNGVSPVDASESIQVTPYLFSIGLHPLKNYTVALPLLVAEPGLKWVIAGPDVHGYRAKIEETAREMGIADRLEFTGAVTEEEKNTLYAGCRALVFPSLAEGFGLPVLEAMSAGKPVFISDLTSLPEIGGTEAYYFRDFEPATIISTYRNGIREYDNDPGKKERLRQWAGRFSWEKSAADYLDFFNNVLESLKQAKRIKK